MTPIFKAEIRRVTLSEKRPFSVWSAKLTNRAVPDPEPILWLRSFRLGYLPIKKIVSGGSQITAP